MRRRDFITLVGGSAAAWPLALRAQQSGQMRRIGVLIPLAKDNSEAQARITAFLQAMQKLGWTEGRNLQIEYRLGNRRSAESCNRIGGIVSGRRRFVLPQDQGAGGEQAALTSINFGFRGAHSALQKTRR